MAAHHYGAWRRIGIIARREYSTTVRRREFLLMTFGLPLLYLLFGVVIIGATAVTATSIARKGTPRVVGFLDQSGALSRAALTRTNDGVAARLYPSVEAGQRAVREKKLRAFVVIPKDFLRSGRVTVYGPEGSIFSDRDRGGLYAGTLRGALLEGKVDAATAKRVVEPIDVTRWGLDEKTGRFRRPDPVRELSRFAVPYGFSLLLMMAILVASSYLLHSVVEEKENRVIEVLLSAVTHEELLAGKLLGLGGAGLTQMGIWLSSSLFLVLLTPRVAPIPPLPIPPGVFVVAALMFILGFGLYAAAMAGLGALGTSWKESQQLAGSTALLAVIPLMFLPVILELPDGGFARFLSLFPFTAPVGMMLRFAAGGASAPEVALSALLLLLMTWGIVRLAGRLFRLSLLLYGQRPTFVQVWRWLWRPA